MIKIMVVGAGVYQYPLIQAAKNYGYVIVCAPEIHDDIMPYIDRCYYCDVRDNEKVLKFAQEEKIDAVVTDQTDIAVRTVAYVAEKMGLPGIGYETATLFTDKGMMRRRLKELGLPTLPSKEVTDLDSALDFFREIGAKVIIKPSDNQGSRGVYEIDDENELEKYFNVSKNYSKNGIVIIEKMASGREFVVEGLTRHGKYSTLICGDTDYFDIENAFAAKTRIFPSSADSSLISRVCDYNKKIIEGFGLDHGITHSEFIMDNDEIFLIETAARGGGVFISSDLIHLGSGLNTEKYIIEEALGYDKPAEFNSEKVSCGYMAFYIPDGEIISIEGIDEVKKLPFVHRNLLDEIKLGMNIKNNNDKTSRLSIIVSGKDRDELMSNMEYIRTVLRIDSKDDHGNIRGIIWQ